MAKTKKIVLLVLLLLVVMVTGCTNASEDVLQDGMLSATYSMEYNQSMNCIPYQIKFNSDGNCVVIKNGYEYLSATYSIGDDGQYVINIPMLLTSWIAKLENGVLMVQGVGISSGGIWTEMTIANSASDTDNTLQGNPTQTTTNETSVSPEINGGINDGVSGILSGTYSMEYNEYMYCVPYKIKFNSDGSCVIIKNGYEYISATYTFYDDGQYVINIPMLLTSWTAKLENGVLMVQGVGISSGGVWRELYLENEDDQSDTTTNPVQTTQTTASTSTTTHSVVESAPEITESFASDFEYTIDGSEVTITGYIGSETDIVIPSEIEGLPVVRLGAFSLAFKDINSIIIPDTVVTIDQGALCWCGLKSVVIPNSVTTIGSAAFSGTHMTSITIPDSVTYIGEDAFDCCFEMASINIPDNIDYIAYNAFAYCTALTDISYKGMRYSYYDCVQLCLAVNTKGERDYTNNIYIDEDHVLRWDEVWNVDSYVVHVTNGNDVIQDECLRNDSENFIYHMRNAEMEPGWYTIIVCGVNEFDPDEHQLITTYDYYFNG